MDILTTADLEQLEQLIPDDFGKPAVRLPKLLLPADLRRLYTDEYSREADADASDGVIVWHMVSRTYLHFETHQNLVEFLYGSNQDNLYWCERIYSTQRQKLRIDFDCKDNRINIGVLQDAIRVLMIRLYSVYLQQCELITCDMSDDKKQSAHIIVDGYYVNSNVEAKYFAEELSKSIAHEGIIDGVDMSIYARATGLRTALSCKYTPSGPVRRKLLPAGTALENTLITYVHMCQELPNICRANTGNENDKIGIEAGENIKVNDITTAIQNIPAQYLIGFRFRNIRGVFINFDRIAPSVCHISNEVHHKDSTLQGIIVNGGIKLRCRHCHGAVLIPCDEVKVHNKLHNKVQKVVKDDRAAKLKKAYKGRQITNLCDKKVEESVLKSDNIYQYIGELNQFGDKMNGLYNVTECGENGENSENGENKIRKINRPPKTLFVKAQMGVGKTSALRRFIDNYPPHSILAVSFRVSFTAGMCSKFDLTSYRDITGPITAMRHNRVMVQCESLYRIEPLEYDLVVLDEVQSIIQQMFSQETHRHSIHSWAILEHMLKHARMVVCMDAYIDQATIDLISQIRGSEGSLVHINNAVAKASQHYIIEKKSIAIAKVMSFLAEGKRVVVPSASCTLAERLYEMARKAYPEKSIKFYSSKTPDEVKARDFADVNVSWAGHDLIIYTPTILAGLSYTGADYDVEVCFWYDNSVDIYGSLQMKGRFRNITSYYHYISEHESDLPDTMDELLDHITESYANFTAAGVPGVDIAGFCENGRVRIHDTPRFRAWLGVQARLNYSKNHFLEGFIRELKLGGGTVSLYREAEDVGREKLVNARLKQIGDEMSAAMADSVSAAPDISADDYERLFAHGVVLTEENQRAILRYQFRRFYKYDREITPTLLINYGKLRLKYQYLRRKRLRIFDQDPEKGLEGLIHGVFALGCEIAGVDIEHVKSVFDVSRDKIAFDLMKVFGRPFDINLRLTREELVAKLHASNDMLVRTSGRVCKVFGAKSVKLPSVTDDDYVKKILDYINGKLDVQYGVKIKATDKHSTMYLFYDTFTTLFDENMNIR